MFDLTPKLFMRGTVTHVSARGTEVKLDNRPIRYQSFENRRLFHKVRVGDVVLVGMGPFKRVTKVTIVRSCCQCLAREYITGQGCLNCGWDSVPS